MARSGRRLSPLMASYLRLGVKMVPSNCGKPARSHMDFGDRLLRGLMLYTYERKAETVVQVRNSHL